MSAAHTARILAKTEAAIAKPPAESGLMICRQCGTDQIAELFWQSPYGEAGGKYSSTETYPPWLCAECGPTTVTDEANCIACEEPIVNTNRDLDDDFRCDFCARTRRRELAIDAEERAADAIADQRKDPPR